MELIRKDKRLVSEWEYSFIFMVSHKKSGDTAKQIKDNYYECIVGQVAIEVHPEFVMVYALEIFSPYRRQGYAKKMLELIRETYSKPIRLTTKKTNLEAQALYTGIGFTKIGETDEQIWLQWGKVEDYWPAACIYEDRCSCRYPNCSCPLYSKK